MVSPATITPHSPILPAHSASGVPSSGGILVTADGRELPLRRSRLEVRAEAGLARVILEQRFENPHGEPLEVGYQLPLPADGAVSGFRFKVGDRLIVGEIDRKRRARERYEEAIATGRTAALLEETRSSLFRQQIGNVPPKSELIAEIAIDQPLIWLAEGCWEWRFPTVVGPRYLGAPGRVQDGSRVVVEIADQPIEHRLALSLAIGDPITGPIESPSHRIAARDLENRRMVELALPEGAQLDRDLVVRWPVAKPVIGMALAVARPASPVHQGDSFGLVTLVPPEPKAAITALPRDLIVLLDTSGSMDGRPIQQAQRLTLALIDSLSDRDRLELIEFSNEPRRFQKEPIVATREGKEAASRWVSALRAGGGTEMKTALLEALSPLRADAQRQVVLVTDGFIGFEREIVEAIVERLPKSCRVHTIGVGSSVNRSLTSPAARAGAGVEIVLGLADDPERAVKRLLERTAEPLVTELSLEGDALLDSVPRQLPDLYRGSPARIALRLRAGGGTIRVRGKTASGPFESQATVRPLALAEGNPAIAALFGREWVEDLETRRSLSPMSEVDGEVERIGLAFQIATRVTSWIAISRDRLFESDRPARKVEMPHELAEGLSIEGLGLRSPGPMPSRPGMAGVKFDAGRSQDKTKDQADGFADEVSAISSFEALDAEESLSDASIAPAEAPKKAESATKMRRAEAPLLAPASKPKPAEPAARAPAGAAPEEKAALRGVSKEATELGRRPSGVAPAPQLRRRQWFLWLAILFGIGAAIAWWFFGRGL